MGRGLLTGEAASEIRPLPYVTPSRVFTLETCFLRAAFDADPRRAAAVFRGPKARLGSASHALLERVSKHELDGVPATERRRRLRELWEEEAGKEGGAARCSELEKHLGPPERWPGYNIQKARAVAAAVRLLERRDKATGGPGGSARAERFYSAYGGRLRGRADSVYSRGSHTGIEDYKTGAIYDEVPGAGLALKPRFRRQLLLYAAMHHDETGEWPATGSVVPLVGPKDTFDIDPVEAEREARAALAAIDAYNERAGTPGIRHESLAAPAPEACCVCDHKLSCEAFWHRAAPEWEWPGGEAIQGTVLRVESGGAGSWRGQVEVRGGTLENGVYGISGSRQVALEEGQRFRATGLRMAGRQESFSLVVTDYTVIQQAQEIGPLHPGAG